MRKLRFIPILAAVLLPLACKHGNHPSGEDDGPVVESVSLAPSETKLGIGKSLQLEVTVLPETVGKVDLRWECSNWSVASVSTEGLVKGIAEGEATVTVFAGSKSASCNVYVIDDDIPVTSVKIIPEMDIEEGREYAIYPVIAPSKATNTFLSWKSSDETIAKFVSYGVVKGIKAGEVTVTASTTDGSNITVTCVVRVHKPGPYNEVRYKSVDQKTVTPYSAKALGTVVSNEYGFEWGVITLKDDLLKIGGSAFQNCVLLTEVALPARITSIEANAFRNCSSLLFINIPDEVTYIGSEAFYLCESLTSITLPDAVKSVGTGVFSRCPALGYIHSPLATSDGRCLVLNGSVVAFAPAGLKEYRIPDSVSGIRASAFKYCQELSSITIPASVTTIGDYAFLNCKSLDSVTLLRTEPPTLDTGVFENVSSLYKIFVPASAVSAYKAAPGWSALASHIQALSD